MKFNKIRLIGSSTIDLPMFGATITDKYILKNVTGLGPPGVDVFISNLPNQGGVYQGHRPQNREIVIRIGFNPDEAAGETVESLRKAFYGLMNGANQIVLVGDTGNVAKAIGYVKNMEVINFTKTPELQVTFACTEPMLSAAFPLSSGLATTNPGDAITGVKVTMVVINPVSLVEFYQYINNNTELEFLTIQFSFQFNDKIIINTNYGERDVTLTRGGVTTSLLPYLNQGNDWPQVYPGLNNLVVYPPGPTIIVTDLVYTPKYWGV